MALTQAESEKLLGGTSPDSSKDNEVGLAT